MRKIPVYLLLIFGAMVFSIPFLWTVSTALKTKEQTFASPPVWIPEPIMWSNFKNAWNALPVSFSIFMSNTIFIAVVSTFGAVLTASVVAFGFARLRFRGREPLFYLVLSTMMLPSQVTMIPVFLIWRELRAIDTFYPLILPAFFGGGAFNIFLLRQFYLSVPKEFDEAAMLDGAGPLRIWWSVVMPLAKPALITVTLFTFIGHWDDFMGPLIYLNSPEKYPVSLGLRMFQDQFGVDLNLMMAAALLHILPMIVLFFFAQRYFVKGINLSGLGGR